MSSLESLKRANACGFYVDRNVEQDRGEKIALYYQERAVSYGDLFNLVCKCGDLFSRAGIEYEKRAAIILPDGPLPVAAIFGLMRIGAVPVPVSTRLSFDDYLYVFADCRPAAAIIAAEHVPTMVKVREALAEHRLPIPKVIWVVGDDPLPPGFRPFEEELNQASPDCDIVATAYDDMALIQYTSGSTGIPKGVVHLHRGLLEVARPLTERIRMNENDKCFSAAKLSFGYGLGNSVFFPFSLGASSILHPGLADPFSVFNVIDSYKPTIFFGVPSLYAAMLEVPGRTTDFDLSSLRQCVSAGEHLNANLFRKWKDVFGLEIIDGIGSTECLHIFICGEPGRLKPGSTGTIIDGNEAKLLDDKGEATRLAEMGELYIKSKSNAARYWNKQDETARTMVGQWTRTGDLFYQDEEGFFYYEGRSDDLIKIGGLKVSPIEVEECLSKHDCVRECGVIGVTTEDGVKTVSAFVSLKPEWEPNNRLKKELKDHVRKSLAPYKCPRRIEFVERIPKTTTGKVARFQLRAAR